MSLSESRKKTASVLVRVDPGDLEVLRAKAADVHLTVPAYLVLCGLGRRTRSRMDGHIVHELRQLAQQQCALYLREATGGEAETTMVLTKIVAAIERIGT